MILWYIYFGIYTEKTSGRSLDQEGVYVTSRSGALTKLIIEDTCSQMIWIFMMMNHLTVMMMRHD
jgi:hypothetical protein